MKKMQIAPWAKLGDVGNFFDDESLFSISPFPKIAWDSAVDTYEEEGKLITKMNIPGLNEKELEISIEDNFLTVFGRRDEEKETEKKNYYSKEIKRGSFTRTIKLPEAVDASNSTAEYKDGEITVIMPILEKTKDKGVLIPINK